MSKETKQNAAQKLQALENLISGQDEKFNVLADEIDGLRDIVRSLNRRLNAVIKAGEGGVINSSSVAKVIVDENIVELEKKIDFLVNNKLIEKSTSTLVTEKTFVIGREIDKDGNVVNPRIQFAVPALEDAALRGKLLASKLGDIIKPEDENNLSLEIMELYDIVEQKVEKKFEEGTTT